MLKVGAQRIKEKTFQTYLKSLTATDDTDYSLWKATKTLKPPTQQFPPIRKKGPDKVKANNFVAHLGKVFKPNELSHNEEFEKEINRTLEEPLQITKPTKFFTPREI
jgi:hypothetical protein